MLGSASPRNPSVRIAPRSSWLAILLVACRSIASRASSGSIPSPSSSTRISFLPPSSIAMAMRRAPASSAFSTSSLTTEAGRSTTSPAAIWFARCTGRRWMRHGRSRGRSRQSQSQTVAVESQSSVASSTSNRTTHCTADCDVADTVDRRLSDPPSHPEEHEHPERYGGHDEQQDPEECRRAESEVRQVTFMPYSR